MSVTNHFQEDKRFTVKVNGEATSRRVRTAMTTLLFCIEDALHLKRKGD